MSKITKKTLSKSEYMKQIYRYNNDLDNVYYNCINAYEKVKNPQTWELCPNCGLIPKVWEFNNGNSTACGCGENMYNHFSIHSESIMSFVMRNNKSAKGYDADELRKNWNHWCKTGEELFLFANKRTDGRW